MDCPILAEICKTCGGCKRAMIRDDDVIGRSDEPDESVIAKTSGTGRYIEVPPKPMWEYEIGE